MTSVGIMKGDGIMANKISVGGIIGSVIFFLSFLPYIHIIYSGLTGILFGIQGFAVFYGYGGLLIDAICLTIFGILPLCFIYQLIFGIKFIKKHHKLRTCTIALIITLILAGIVTEPIAVTIHGTDLVSDVAKVQEFNSQKHWPW